MIKYIIPIFIFFIFIHCQNTPPSKPKNKIEATGNMSGKELAQIYCGNCHQYPDPSLLDKTTWAKELLPNMGARLGIHTEGYDPFKNIKGLDKMMIQTENIYPTTPLLKQEDWDKIVAFYQNESPETLKWAENKQDIGILKGFSLKTTDVVGFPPLITLTKIDTTHKNLFIGTLDGKLSIFSTKNKNLTLQMAYPMPSAPVSILQPDNDQIMVLGIGIIHPNEQQEGQLYQLTKSTQQQMPLLSMLKRPVHVASASKGQSDLMICEYGYQKGRLTFYKKINNKWAGQLVSDTAGSTKAVPYDFNKDGLMDYAVLMAQSDERINIYYGLKNGKFQAKQVVQFPPVYGSSDMQLVDFNQDGYMDILYTNGDNEDFSTILKPYHGIRVFLNDGKDNFTEGVFYPMHGAFQAKAADFDADGDMDIAAVAFFPKDKTKPASHFLYLEQIKPNEFKPYTFKEATQGKWMTLDIGDADGDGDTDILLGSFVISLAGNSKTIDKNEKVIPFLLLENKYK